MLRGAIDFTSSSKIGGWIYADVGQVQGRTILAFLDGRCVGAGLIDRFRQDLADAGLGDGYLGFNFGITVTNAQDVERVVVKLEGSDLALVQPSARIERASATVRGKASLLQSPAKIEWMRTRGWLEQAEFDFLKSLSQIGVYDLSLRHSKSTEKALGTPLLDPVQAAQRMLGLISFEEVDLVTQEITAFSDLVNAAALSQLPDPVAALWSAKRESVLVVEGSNNDTTTPLDAALQGAIEYPCGPDRLLFLDLRCRFGTTPGPTSRKLTAFMVKT
jgi:hypothetical protein